MPQFLIAVVARWLMALGRGGWPVNGIAHLQEIVVLAGRCAGALHSGRHARRVAEVVRCVGVHDRSAAHWGTREPPVIEPNSVEARTLHATIERVAQASRVLERGSRLARVSQ